MTSELRRGTAPTFNVLPKAGSRRALTVALALIALLSIIPRLAIHHIVRSVEEQSVRSERQAMLSVEQLATIERLLDRERILIDDHISSTDSAEMRSIEASRDRLLADLDTAKQTYVRLIDLPNEGERWAAVSHQIDAFHSVIPPIIGLSQQNEDIAALAKWRATRQEYESLHEGLTGLIELNRTGALSSLDRIDEAERFANQISDVIGYVALVGIVWTWLWMSRRITSYEEQLREREAELCVQNSELDTFAGRVAHDLKNALAPLCLSAASLRRSADDPVRVRQLADRVERVSRRADSVVSALLTFSRASRDVHPDESGSVRAVLEDVLEEVGPAAIEHDVTIDASAVADVNVRCDRTLLHVVIANVVGNAVKYLDGRPVRHVRIAATAEGDGCRIDVDDTGPGIPADAREKIFEPFYRVRGSCASGTGIGLATVRRILDAREGRIEVESTEGKGSSFHLWFQRAAPT
jgi:signal transduction histidine kinase